MDKIVIYTDGACKGNPGPGGWAALLMYKEHEKLIGGSNLSTTNNRMELTATIEALKNIKINTGIIVYTDSKYIIKGITEWINGWIKSNWNSNTVKNQDLWKELHSLTSRYSIEWRWVKGHSGDQFNELVDTHAKEQILLALSK